MKIFIDTANLQDIEAALQRGFIRGITTNPSLLSKEPKTQFEKHIGQIIDLINTLQPGVSLSVEVFSRDPKEIIRQAKYFVKTFAYPELAIKVQIGWDELAVIKELAAEGIQVNCTCVMTVNQAVMAAAAGSRFVSLFWCRIRDGIGEKHKAEREEFMKIGNLEQSDFDPSYVVQEARKIFDRAYSGVEIIAGSLRGAVDVKAAGLSGAHIVTVPPKFFLPMVRHFKTDEVVQQFLNDFSSWMS